MTALVDISAELSARVEELDFPSVPFVYNPLAYARAPHEAYLERWGAMTPRDVLMVGMNPGPFGMAQTGVPFGDVPWRCAQCPPAGLVVAVPVRRVARALQELCPRP